MHAFPRAWRTFLVAMAVPALFPGAMAADPAIDPARLLDHTRRLASDEYEGRAPGSPGEERTVQDVAEQFRSSGLKPAGANGGWFQPVPIVGITCTADPAWRTGGRRQPLTFPQDIVLWSPLTNSEVRLDSSEVVFVGYGVHAPEYGWDDYKGVDVRGKTVVMLVNDPPVPDPKRAGELDPAVFQGRGMTYYGRWTYKFEEAARRGASAALLVHETAAASYPWFVVVNTWGRERFELAGDTEAKCPLAGWLSLDAAKELLQSGGLSYEDARARAVRRDFRPIPLPRTFEVVSTQRCRAVDSRNVVGILDGTDARRRNEYVVVTAHWDHLGRDPRREGDQIFNGAADNATGTAGLLELARVMAADTRRRPGRSIVFVALTAEEQGLLGARHYVRKPPLPLAATVANINIDVLNTWGRTRDIRQVGLGHSTLDAVLAAVARRAGRAVLPDPRPESGIFYRSDHFEFLKGGVPALYLMAGDRFLDDSAGSGEARAKQYVANDYHKVSDDVKPAWDLRGAAADLEILREVALRVANERRRPRWNRGSEFAR